MKINTISAYVLVYLLARGHWNLMVPVRADDDADGSSGLASGDAGSAPAGGSMAGSSGGSSSPTRARSKAGSSAGSTAGSTAGSDVANLSSLSATDPDGSSSEPAANDGSGTSPDANAGQVNADTVLISNLYPESSGSAVGTHPELALDGSSEGGQSEPKSTMVELGSLYPGAGLSPVEYREGLFEAAEAKVALDAKKEEANLLADDARKTAEKLKKAAEDMIKQADELTKAAQDAKDVEELAAKMDAAAYNVGVARTEAAEDSKPLDWMYYGGFPDGHHYRATDDMLIKLYKLDRRANNEMWRDGFPNGWHGLDFGNLDIMEKEAKKHRDEKYEKERMTRREQITAKSNEIEAKDKQIAVKNAEMDLKKEGLEAKHNQLTSKRQEIMELRKYIEDLKRELAGLEIEARTILRDHVSLDNEYKVLEREHTKLEDDKSKLEKEHAALEEDDRQIVRRYYELTGLTSYLDGKPTATDAHVDPRDNFSSFTEELGLLEAGEGEVKHKYIGDLNPADTFSEHPLYTATPVSGGSLEALAAGHAEVGQTAGETVDASSTVPAEDNSVATPAEGVSVVAEPTPAAEHVASTPVPAPVPEAPANEGEVKAESGQSVPAAVRLFKTDADGNEVEMVETTDYEKKHVSGDDRYEFKSGVKCVKVMFGNHELWKKGEQDLNDPKFVGYNDTVNVIVVRENDWTAVYKKEDLSDNWKFINKVQKQQKASGTSRTAAHTGSSAGSTPAPESTDSSAPGSLSSGLSGSVVNLETASTGSGEDETSSVTSEPANLEDVSEGSGSSTLRGAGAAAE